MPRRRPLVMMKPDELFPMVCEMSPIVVAELASSVPSASTTLSRVPEEPSCRTTWPLVNGDPLWL